MKRLLWKEWHERALWLTLWVLAVVVTTALGKGQSICGYSDMMSIWSAYALTFPFLAGLSAYGSELKGERVYFLYSRALSWKQVLAAKIIPGIVVALLAPLLGVLAVLLFIPAQYHPFMTPTNLLNATKHFAFPTTQNKAATIPAGGEKAVLTTKLRPKAPPR